MCSRRSGRSHHPTNETSSKHQNLVARARTSCARHRADPFTVVPTIYSRRRREPSYHIILLLLLLLLLRIYVCNLLVQNILLLYRVIHFFINHNTNYATLIVLEDFQIPIAVELLLPNCIDLNSLSFRHYWRNASTENAFSNI